MAMDFFFLFAKNDFFGINLADNYLVKLKIILPYILFSFSTSFANSHKTNIIFLNQQNNIYLDF